MLARIILCKYDDFKMFFYRWLGRTAEVRWHRLFARELFPLKLLQVQLPAISKNSGTIKTTKYVNVWKIAMKTVLLYNFNVEVGSNLSKWKKDINHLALHFPLWTQSWQRLGAGNCSSRDSSMGKVGSGVVGTLFQTPCPNWPSPLAVSKYHKLK